jgi:hypothetical protein
LLRFSEYMLFRGVFRWLFGVQRAQGELKS